MRACGLGEHIRVESADFTEDGGYRATVRLLSSAQPPTAIFAVDDLTCVGARSAASEMNVDVPGRLSLVGYDNTYLARLRSIWLTSVDSAGFDAGRLAARTLLARVADPARPAELHLLPPALEVRGSTAPRPSETAKLRYFSRCVRAPHGDDRSNRSIAAGDDSDLRC